MRRIRYSDASHLLERANTWLGRGVSLDESREKFTLHLIVGKPRDAKLTSSFMKALNILHECHCDTKSLKRKKPGNLLSTFRRTWHTNLSKHAQMFRMVTVSAAPCRRS